MKKVLYGIIVLDVLAAVVSFFVLLGSNVIMACLALIGAAVSLVPLILLLQCIDRIEGLEIRLDTLQQKLRAQERTANESEPEETSASTYDAPLPKMTSSSRWVCSKCQSINKSGTAVCDSCGAHYSLAADTPAEMPLTKWKLKENKKK